MAWLLDGDIRGDDDNSENGIARAFVWCFLFWAGVFLIFAAACHPSIVRADHTYSCGYQPNAWWPRPVWIDPRLDSAPWQLGMAKWNQLGGNEFLQVSDSNSAPTWIVPSPNGKTWVWINCNGVESVVYVGTDVSIAYWAPHELGHVWAHYDHVTSGTNLTNYWPGTAYCNAYRGAMSYCSLQSEWFGVQDRIMHRGY